MSEKIVTAPGPALAANTTTEAASQGGLTRSLLRRWRTPLLIFVVWRLIFVPIALIAGNLLPFNDEMFNVFVWMPQRLNTLGERLVGVWNHWDGQWFLYVAQVGYRPGDDSAPYFPLYPLAAKITSWLFGGDLALGGAVIATVFGLTTFILFYELVRYEFTPRIASRSLVSLAVYPVSFFLVACYSEGVFMSLMLGAFLAARRYRNWPVVGLLVGLASLSRNMGIWLMLPLGWEWAAQNWQILPQVEGRSLWQRLNVPWRKLFSLPTLFFVGVPTVCFGSLLLFDWATLGSPFQFVKDTTVRFGWDRQTSWPWQTVGYIFRLYFQDHSRLLQDPSLTELVIWTFNAFLWLVALRRTWRREWRLSYFLVFTLALLLPLSAVNPVEPLISYPRYSLLAFPLFVVLGSAKGPARSLVSLYMVLSFLLLLFFFARFANWFWVA